MLKLQKVAGSIAGAIALHAGGMALADDADMPITTNNDVGMEQVSAEPAVEKGKAPAIIIPEKHDYSPTLELTQSLSLQKYKTPIGDFETARSETKAKGQLNLPFGFLLEGEGYYTTHDNFTVDYNNRGQKTPNSEFVVQAQPHYILSIPALKGQKPEKDGRVEISYFTLQKKIGGTVMTLGALKPEMRMGATSLIPGNIIDYLPDQALLTPRMAALHISQPIVKTDKFDLDLNIMAGTVLQRVVGPYDLGVLGGNIIVHSIRDSDPKNRSYSQPAETTDTGHAFGSMIKASYQLTPSLSILAAASAVQPNGATNYKPPHLRGSGVVMASYKRQFDDVAFTLTGSATLGSYRRDYFGMVTSPSTVTYTLASSIAKDGYKLSAELGSTTISNTGNVRSDGDVTAFEARLNKTFDKGITAGFYMVVRNTDLYAARVHTPRPYYPVSRQPDVVAGGFDISIKLQ